MKKFVLLTSVFGMLGIVGPASAAVAIDFGGDNNLSPAGNCALVNGVSAICTNIAVGVLTVTGDGAYNGTYGIDGTVGGDGDLSFNTTTNTITIVGSIDCTSVFGPACTSLGKVLVPTGTTLLSGVDGTTGGAFSSLIVVAGPTTGAVSFTDTDSKSEALLTALGLGALEVGCSSNLCPGWDLTGFSLGTQDTGSKYTAISSDVLDTSTVPEPTSVLLLGTVLFGVTGLIRRRAKKA